MRDRPKRNLEVLHCPCCGAWYLVREPARVGPRAEGWPRWFQCHRCRKRVSSRVFGLPLGETAACSSAG